MSQSLAIIITLCHQSKSEYYNTKALIAAMIQATQKTEEMLPDVNIMLPFSKTSKTTFLIPSSYDTDCNSFPPQKSKLLI